MTTTTTQASEWLGDFRTPRNTAAEHKGSIHDDATASKLGFKGGTVAGSVHMDQFVPKLLEIYGERWFKDGSISLYFTQATVDAERVRAVVQPDPQRSRLRMYNEPGDQILEGTASVGGPDAQSELQQRFAKQPSVEPQSLRILNAMRVGDENHDLKVSIAPEVLEQALATITEEVPAYRKDRVLPPSHIVRLAHITRPVVMAKSVQPQVGLFGALEVQHLEGPLRAGIEYSARTRILKFTESPKTENVWYDVIFRDPQTGRDAGSVRYFLRILKNSSPLYADAKS